MPYADEELPATTEQTSDNGGCCSAFLKWLRYLGMPNEQAPEDTSPIPAVSKEDLDRMIEKAVDDAMNQRDEAPSAAPAADDNTAEPEESEGTTEGDEDATKDADDTSTETPPEPPTCPESYHEHGCPYSGCPYTGRCYTPPAYTPAPAAEPETQPVKPTKPAKKIRKEKKKEPYKKKPTMPVPEDESDLDQTLGLDTMEYRPSDGDEHAFDDLRF
jgi:hypothetical protein